MMNQAQQMKMQCQNYVNQPVQLQVHGQSGYSGIIEHVDDENVYLMVPVDESGQYIDLVELMNGYHPINKQAGEQSTLPLMGQEINVRNERYPFYPPYPPYPYYPYPRPRGWGRLILPLAALTALAVLI